uniref:Diphthine--ammonia ligase n=3 Tax=Palpitomonas bilix TaxID=652834 RepID=A0A7S3D931_9EUKA|mmetsp:Transcript_27154/g.69979  ORF Transcript_27154/g.69979 Transcript_27154/m.69979 type:complete len:835 (+) Transcript_27154:164-2668(+)
MKVVALLSGGKDSCYNIALCTYFGHEVVAAANLHPRHGDPEELDSHMFQTVGSSAIQAVADALGLPLFQQELVGRSVCTDMEYSTTEGDEVEDLKNLLITVKEKIGDVEGVSVGAILSNYQRARVELVCRELGLLPLAFLWEKEQRALMREMVAAGVDARLIKTASFGLHPKKHLLRSLEEMEGDFLKLQRQNDLNICGEGGEYETLTVSGPFFEKRVVLEETTEVKVSDDPFSPVSFISIPSLRLEDIGNEQGASKDKIDATVRAVQKGKYSAARLVGRAVDGDGGMYTSEWEGKLIGSTSESMGGNERCNEGCVWSPSPSPPVLSPGTEGGARRVGKDSLHAAGEWVNGDVRLERGTKIGENSEVVDDIARGIASVQARLPSSAVVDFVSVTLARMEDFALFNQAYAKVFPSENPPARAAVAVSSLPSFAHIAIHYSRGAPSDERAALQVMSRSSWAPAMIGPYSQASWKFEHNQGVVWVAGQIGMIPESLDLVTTMCQTLGDASGCSNGCWLPSPLPPPLSCLLSLPCPAAETISSLQLEALLSLSHLSVILSSCSVLSSRYRKRIAMSPFLSLTVVPAITIFVAVGECKNNVEKSSVQRSALEAVSSCLSLLLSAPLADREREWKVMEEREESSGYAGNDADFYFLSPDFFDCGDTSWRDECQEGVGDILLLPVAVDALPKNAQLEVQAVGLVAPLSANEDDMPRRAHVHNTTTCMQERDVVVDGRQTQMRAFVVRKEYGTAGRVSFFCPSSSLLFGLKESMDFICSLMEEVTNVVSLRVVLRCGYFSTDQIEKGEMWLSTECPGATIMYSSKVDNEISVDFLCKASSDT